MPSGLRDSASSHFVLKRMSMHPGSSAHQSCQWEGEGWTDLTLTSEGVGIEDCAFNSMAIFRHQWAFLVPRAHCGESMRRYIL